jgi:hypothetical protein
LRIEEFSIETQFCTQETHTSLLVVLAVFIGKPLSVWSMVFAITYLQYGSNNAIAQQEFTIAVVIEKGNREKRV